MQNRTIRETRPGRRLRALLSSQARTSDNRPIVASLAPKPSITLAIAFPAETALERTSAMATTRSRAFPRKRFGGASLDQG